MTNSGTSCPCLSGLDLADCCGPFEGAAHPSGEVSVEVARASLRSLLLLALREGQSMQEMWFAFLDEQPDRLLESAEAASDRQILADHFLWDWFHRYSESRPLCRAARAVESTDLRGGSKLDEWALASWEPWEVVSGSEDTWTLHRIGADRRIAVHGSFDHHRFQIGDAILSRVLSHLGHRFLGLSVSVFPGSKGRRELQTGYDRILREFGLASHVHLRPDIHNEAWLPLHDRLFALALHLKPGVPSPGLSASVILDTPRQELGGSTPRQSALHEFGRHRLRQWLKSLAEPERRMVESLLD